MSFFVKAVVHGLQAVPEVNAQIDGDDLVQNHYYDIGVAVGLKGAGRTSSSGLRNISFAEVEQQIIGYAQKAREGKLSLNDLQEESSLYQTVVSMAQCSLRLLLTRLKVEYGMHAIQQRPVANNGEVVIRQ